MAAIVMASCNRRRVYLADILTLDCDLADPVWSATEVYYVIEWLLKKIVIRLPFRTIRGPNGDAYLTRWYLYPGKPRSDGEGTKSDKRFAVFIHFFHRSDKDRDPHNHPWDRSLALILKGGYVEERAGRRKTFRPGMINIITRNDYHRVDLLDPTRGSWSLFFAGKNMGDWGFRHRQTGIHIPQGDYLNENTVR